METSVTLHSLSLRDYKSFLLAGIFVGGNILLPQLCHFVPNGGLIFLPIYFFTLLAAYKYGLGVGLLTAILSPTINCLLFGMPAFDMLPAILVKSTLLALSAGLIARHTGKVTISALIVVVLSYQVCGSLFEWAFVGNFYAAIQDFKLGVPGLFIQVLGCYWLIKKII